MILSPIFFILKIIYKNASSPRQCLQDTFYGSLLESSLLLVGMIVTVRLFASRSPHTLRKGRTHAGVVIAIGTYVMEGKGGLSEMAEILG